MSKPRVSRIIVDKTVDNGTVKGRVRFNGGRWFHFTAHPTETSVAAPQGVLLVSFPKAGRRGAPMGIRNHEIALREFLFERREHEPTPV